jgi:hypothetical protein
VRAVRQLLTGAVVVVGQVEVNPSAEGLPGGDLIQRLLNWGQMGALWASLAAVLAGGAYYGWSQVHGSYAGAAKGKAFAVGGAVGAVITGLAPLIVNTLFNEVS